MRQLHDFLARFVQRDLAKLWLEHQQTVVLDSEEVICLDSDSDAETIASDLSDLEDAWADLNLGQLEKFLATDPPLSLVLD